MIKKTKWIILLILMIGLAGCGKDNNMDLNKTIKNITINYTKEGVDCRVEIDFITSKRSVTIYGSELPESEDDYSYLDELEKFTRDNILADKKLYVKDKKSNNEAPDDQKIMWHIRVTFEDGSWAQIESFENNPYNPEYLDSLIALIEK